MFISSVDIDLVCLRLDFKELKSSHSWSVHCVNQKLPHKVSNCQGPPKVIFGGGKKEKNICECVVRMIYVCAHVHACVSVYMCTKEFVLICILQPCTVFKRNSTIASKLRLFGWIEVF